MKHIDFVVKASQQTVRVPAALRVLIDNPEALGHVGEIDMDAVHQLPGGVEETPRVSAGDSRTVGNQSPARSIFGSVA